MTQSTNTVVSGASWAAQVIDLYTQGGSDAEVAASLRVPIRKFYKQMSDSPAFADLVEFGRTLSLAFWEGAARKNVGNKSFNSSLFAFYMKNRHGWADKTEVSSTSENTNINLDDARRIVDAALAERIKEATPELTDAQRVFSSKAVVNE